MTRDNQANQAEQGFERKLSALPTVFDFIDTWLTTHSIGGEEAYAINLSIEELFTNAVKFSPLAADPINLCLRLEDKQVVVTFRDSGGTAFDITSADSVDIDQPIDQVRPGGLGLHLIKCVMDEVSHQYTGNANIITMKLELE